MTPAEIDAGAGGENGFSALHFAAALGSIRVCGVLIQAGARLDNAHSGQTPLMCTSHSHPDSGPLQQLLSGNWAGPLPGTCCERCAAVPDSALLFCGGCQSVAYCCPRCAKADWPRHAADCKEVRAAQQQIGIRAPGA